MVKATRKTDEEPFNVIGAEQLPALWERARKFPDIVHEIKLSSDKKWVRFVIHDIADPTCELVVPWKKTKSFTDYSVMLIRAVASDLLRNIIKRANKKPELLRIRQVGGLYWFDCLVSECELKTSQKLGLMGLFVHFHKVSVK